MNGVSGSSLAIWYKDENSKNGAEIDDYWSYVEEDGTVATTVTPDSRTPPTPEDKLLEDPSSSLAADFTSDSSSSSAAESNSDPDSSSATDLTSDSSSITADSTSVSNSSSAVEPTSDLRVGHAAAQTSNSFGKSETDLKLDPDDPGDEFDLREMDEIIKELAKNKKDQALKANRSRTGSEDLKGDEDVDFTSLYREGKFPGAGANAKRNSNSEMSWFGWFLRRTHEVAELLCGDSENKN